jgi:transcriptional regulator with XRE-family HTH domain
MSDVFGRKLRAYRKLKHWTQSELAKEVDVSVAIIGSLERGTRIPTKDILQKLKHVLCVSEQELFGIESDLGERTDKAADES